MRFRHFAFIILALAFGAFIFNDFSLNLIAFVGVERFYPFYRFFLLIISNRTIAQCFGLHPLK